MAHVTEDILFETIQALVLCHSPSGQEQEIDQELARRFRCQGLDYWQDPAGNLIAKIPGRDSQRHIAITAHKDEIGMMVKTVEPSGRLQIRRLGGSFPWVYGEGVVDILGDQQTLSGILSFGSRHVSHESPQKAQQEESPLRWEDAWVETLCTASELAQAGVRPGSRVVIGKHRKQPLRLKDYIASYTLDNKASLAILLALAQAIQDPWANVYLVASAKEEIGALGALYFTQKQSLEALIALEICPLSAEYPLQLGPDPVLLSQDGYGLYDEGLNQALRRSAQAIDLPLQLAVISGFGSDASIAMKFGHVARAACLSFPTQNTHGYEIASLVAMANCTRLLAHYLSVSP